MRTWYERVGNKKLGLPKVGTIVLGLRVCYCRNWDDETKTKGKVFLRGQGKRTYITSRHWPL